MKLSVSTETQFIGMWWKCETIYIKLCRPVTVALLRQTLYTFQDFVWLLLGFTCFKLAMVTDCLLICNQCAMHLWSMIQLSFIQDKSSSYVSRLCRNVNQSTEREKNQEIYLKSAVWTLKEMHLSHIMQTSFLFLHKDISLLYASFHN